MLKERMDPGLRRDDNLGNRKIFFVLKYDIIHTDFFFSLSC